MNNKTRAIGASVLAAGVLLGASACAGGDSNSGSKSERATQQQIENRLEVNQPIPVHSYSQMRQNLIEIENAEADGVQSTTFFFNQGVANPIMQCASIGSPIASTAQLSDPQKVEHHWGDGNGGNVTLPQMEPNGIYTGDSSGTWSLCLKPDGKPYAQYWEGYVATAFGPAKWDGHQIVLTGDPSMKFTKGK